HQLARTASRDHGGHVPPRADEDALSNYNLNTFLETQVEGNLLGDLEAMANVRANVNGQGGLNYPMLMTAVAGIELLGWFVHNVAFNMNEGLEPFNRFWGGFLYDVDPRRGYARDVYQAARHGLAHLFIPKELVQVGRENARHLERDSRSGVLCIN